MQTDQPAEKFAVAEKKFEADLKCNNSRRAIGREGRIRRKLLTNGTTVYGLEIPN